MSNQTRPRARSAAIPGAARNLSNPVPDSPQVEADARAHWADHCAAPPTLLLGYGAQREHALAHGIEALAAEPW